MTTLTAIQALNHKDINGALEHLRLIGQELGILNKFLPSKVINGTKMDYIAIYYPRTYVKAIVPEQSIAYSKRRFSLGYDKPETGDCCCRCCTDLYSSICFLALNLALYFKLRSCPQPITTTWTP